MIPVTHRKNQMHYFDSSVNAGQDYLDEIRQKLATDRATHRNYNKHPLDDTDAVIFGDGVKTVLIRKPTNNERCVIDWLNITLDAKQFYLQMPKNLPEYAKQDRLVKIVSKKLLNAIGFGVDVENETGRNFYQRSFTLEHGTGLVCIGGQKDTLMITINGTGCTYASFDWEYRLYLWLKDLLAVNITRIDLAHDVLNSNFLTVDLFNEIHSNGGFTKGGRPPDIEYRGNWKNPNGKGRTLYIGSRQSDKFCRIYEKGKQLGDSDSNWLRIEVEYKAKDIYIPLSVLLTPTDYFIASYPCFYLIDENEQDRRFEVRDKQEQLTFANAIELVKRQYGRYLHLFRNCFCDDKVLLDILTDISNKAYPERLNYLTIPKELDPKPDIVALINQAKGLQPTEQNNATTDCY